MRQGWSPWDWMWLGLVLAAGLLPRLAFVTLFPTRPISDFHVLVEFGVFLRDRSLTASGFFWDLLNPGLPMALSLIFRIFPGAPPQDAARLATAAVTGLVPALPFLLWRGVLPLPHRLLASGLLALWPGQIVFSGVVAQDNWVLFPVVALAALSVRSLALGQGHPVAAGLLYALGVSIRQEMLVVLLPLLAVASLGGRNGALWKRAVPFCVLAAGIPLFLLALQRQAATGRFAVTTEHSGFSVLGAYVPGATANAWTDPTPYIASVEPSLLRDFNDAQRQGVRLALREALRRPAFHAARITAFTLYFATSSEASSLYWCLSSDVLPLSHQARAQAISRFVVLLLRIESTLLLALFVAILLVDPVRQSLGIRVLCAAVVLKAGLHLVTVAQGRFFLSVTALQILVLALGSREAADRPRRRVVAAVAAGAVVATGVTLLAPGAVDRVRARDVDGPRTYRFSLGSSPGDREDVLDCVVRRGRLLGLSENGATIRMFHPEPSPGETATAECALKTSGPLPPLAIRLLDSYDPGGSPGRMVQRVVVNGREVFVHDVAGEPGGGWSEVPLGKTDPGTKNTIVVEVAALRPDPGTSWGQASTTAFLLVDAQPEEP